jgi:hypothetical protein
MTLRLEVAEVKQLNPTMHSRASISAAGTGAGVSTQSMSRFCRCISGTHACRRASQMHVASASRLLHPFCACWQQQCSTW